jgi:uncharacterized protein YqcC (DUF446 family)
LLPPLSFLYGVSKEGLPSFNHQLVTMMATDMVSEKIHEIIRELQQQQLWKKHMPDWVTDYSTREIISEEDFAGWLQFVLLPNLQQQNSLMTGRVKNYVAPQAVRFFSHDVKKGRLLQLLIELDSLS